MKEIDKKALDELLKYFKRKKYTPETIKRWTTLAIEYLVFLETKGRTINDIGDLLNSEGKVVQREPFGVRDFLDIKSDYEASYLNYLCHVLKRFYTAWEKHFSIPDEDFPKVKKEPKRIMLATGQILQMAKTAQQIWLKRIKADPNDLTGLRDYTLVLLSIGCGARRYQLSKLNCKFYDFEKKILFIPAAKGGRDTSRVLNKPVADVLEYYLAKRKIAFPKQTAMFLAQDGTRMGVSSMSDQFAMIRETAGIHVKGAGFHSLRRAKVLRMKKAKLTDEEKNAVMGWKLGSKMSHIYGELDSSEVQKKATDLDTIFDKKDKELI